MDEVKCQALLDEFIHASFHPPFLGEDVSRLVRSQRDMSEEGGRLWFLNRRIFMNWTDDVEGIGRVPVEFYSRGSRFGNSPMGNGPCLERKLDEGEISHPSAVSRRLLPCVLCRAELGDMSLVS